MKKLLLGLLLVFSLGINAQAFTEDGVYLAKITIERTEHEYYFEAYQGIVVQLDEDQEDMNFDNQRTCANGATTIFSWLNARGPWSESQTFVFTRDKDSDKIYVHLLRVVQNKGKLPWNLLGTGDVIKLK